jgi:ribosome maturation factor RimP
MNPKSKTELLNDLVARTLENSPLELVLCEFKKAGSEWVLRVFIDHADGVSVEHCQAASNLITDALEEEDPIGSDYHIEVSSPGVDRPLVKAADYQRFLNQRVYIKSHAPVDGLKAVTGTLSGCSEDGVDVINEHDGNSYHFTFGVIAKATLKPILNFC